MTNISETYKRYRILITGGSGFLGKAIVRELLGENPLIQVEEIRVFDVNNIIGIVDNRINLLKGDVRDYQ